MTKYLLAVCWIVFFTTANTEAQSDRLGTWDVFEISLKVPLTFQNPYTDCLKEGQKSFVSARFEGVSGEATNKIIEVPGFWDGGTDWKIRFTPPYSGTWKYETFSGNKGVKQKKGEVIVSGWSEEEKKANPSRRGFIRVNNAEPRAGRYFTYSDGTPFLWIGDTWWNWTNRNITFESFKKLADTRSAQGFNLGQLFFAGNGWGPESSLLDSTFMHPEIEQIRKVEKMIAYANSKGITVWIHAWWCRENMNNAIGSENIRRWWRYVIHRLHAYNVIWVIAGEYNMYNYGGFPPEFWNELGGLIKSEDPYKRIVGAHPTPPMWEGGADAPQWSTAEAIHSQPWLDYNQSQSGHARWCNELIPEIIKTAYAKQPAKPIVVTEPWYEFTEGNPTAMDIRYAAWTAIMSGAAGHSYGGGHIWKAHLPENRFGPDPWPMDTSLKTNTMLYPGAVSLGFAGKYLRNLQWWKLEPHPELAGENPSHYCLADPGREYLFYLRYGGSVRIDLSRFPASMKFRYQWTDLVNQRDSGQGTLSGGSVTEIKCPEDYPGTLLFKDWILHVLATSETHPDNPVANAIVPGQSQQQKPDKRQAGKTADRAPKDYSKYQDIFDLIRGEITNVKVEGTNVYSIKGLSFSLTSQVLYDVDGMILSDISFVTPSEVEKIEYFDDSEASAYGMRGANGVIKIKLRKQ
jgi:hypothetical protein